VNNMTVNQRMEFAIKQAVCMSDQFPPCNSHVTRLGLDAQFSREVWCGKTDSPVIVYWHYLINHCSRGRLYLFSFIRTPTMRPGLSCAVPASTGLVDGSMLLLLAC